MIETNVKKKNAMLVYTENYIDLRIFCLPRCQRPSLYYFFNFVEVLLIIIHTRANDARVVGVKRNFLDLWKS